MKINKIKDKLDFDVETQGADCMHDCPIKGNITVVTGQTWEAIVGTAGLRDVNACKLEIKKGVIGYGPIYSEWL